MLGKVLTTNDWQVLYTVPSNKTSAIVNITLQRKVGTNNGQETLVAITNNPATVTDDDAYLFVLYTNDIAELTGLVLQPGDSILVRSRPTVITGEEIGTGDGTTTNFSKVLTTIIVPGTVSVTYTIAGTTTTVTDDGQGNISDQNVTGTIDYQSGSLVLNFSTAPDNGTSITASYQAYNRVLALALGMEV